MPKIKFEDIENAFEYVSMAPMYTNSAFVNRRTGDIFYYSEYAGIEELPEGIEDVEDIFEDENFIDIPHKNELDLGKNLAIQFISINLPAEVETAYAFFRKRGAYSKFKNLLEQRNLLDEWYAFETEMQTKALKSWCQSINLEFDT